MQIFLDKGADVNAPGGDKRSALQEASINGHESIVQLLLDRGADVNASCNDGSALHFASNLGHKSVMQILLDNGADINASGGEQGPELVAPFFTLKYAAAAVHICFSTME